MDAGERLIGPDGASWRNIAEWLEPDGVRTLVEKGVPLAVDWCEQWEWPADLRPDVEKMTVSALESHRLSAGRSGELILAPEPRVQHENGPFLIVLSEETAKRRKVMSKFKRVDRALLQGVEGQV